MYLTEPLNDNMIAAGASLTKELIKEQLIVKASFWLYVAEPQSWRLIIATPELASFGPKKIYQKVQRAIHKLKQTSLTKTIALENVSIVENDHPLVDLFRIAIKTGPTINGGIRFSKNTINGHYIEDAYIYLMT